MSCRMSSPFLKMMAFCSLEVYYLESEHVLSEVVPVLEDDGVLLMAPHLVRQRIRILPHLRKGNQSRNQSAPLRPPRIYKVTGRLYVSDLILLYRYNFRLNRYPFVAIFVPKL